MRVWLGLVVQDRQRERERESYKNSECSGIGRSLLPYFRPTKVEWFTATAWLERRSQE